MQSAIDLIAANKEKLSVNQPITHAMTTDWCHWMSDQPTGNASTTTARHFCFLEKSAKDLRASAAPRARFA